MKLRRLETVRKKNLAKRVKLKEEEICGQSALN